MSFGSHITQLHSSYLNRGTQKQRRFREGTKRTFRNITSQKQVHADDQSAFPPWWLASLAQVTTMGLCPLLQRKKVLVAGYSATPHTHTHSSEGRKTKEQRTKGRGGGIHRTGTILRPRLTRPPARRSWR